MDIKYGHCFLLLQDLQYYLTCDHSLGLPSSFIFDSITNHDIYEIVDEISAIETSILPYRMFETIIRFILISFDI